MKNLTDTCVVLRSIDFKESDKILTLFGKHLGKFPIIAKGVRKIESKNRGYIQTLSVIKISAVQVHGMPILKEVDGIYIPDYTIKEYQNIERVLFMINKFIPENEPDDDIFDGLVKTIKSKFTLESVNRFRILFLIKQGVFNPELECTVCGKKGEYLNKLDFSISCNDHIGFDNENMIKLDSSVYSKLDFTVSLDNYINRILKGI